MASLKTLFIIGKVWPEPNSSAAGTRMMQIINMFQNQGWRIIFSSPAATSGFAENLDALEIESVSVKINDSSFDDYISKLQPEMVLFDRFTTEEQFGWRVAGYSPDSLRILDTVDLHSLRLARQQAVKEKRTFAVQDIKKTDVAKREIASIYRCDLTLMISEAEMQILQEIFHISGDLLHYLPFLVDTAELAAPLPFDERSDFVTIGNFLHPPNRDSVRFLKSEIWPAIKKKLPDARLNVYGAYPSQQDFQLHNERQGFIVHGRAESAKKVIQRAKILLAPLRYGAGMKGKLLDAMMCGTPSVTTEIGAEGMHIHGLWNGNIAAGKRNIIDAACSLYTNKTEWEKAQNAGFEILEKRFSKSLFLEPFMEQIFSMLQNLAIHRQKNFTGQMLLHHTISGTKYMARWIEEKNKN